MHNEPYERYENQKFSYKLLNSEGTSLWSAAFELPYRDKYFTLSNYSVTTDATTGATALLVLLPGRTTVWALARATKLNFYCRDMRVQGRNQQVCSSILWITICRSSRLLVFKAYRLFCRKGRKCQIASRAFASAPLVQICALLHMYNRGDNRGLEVLRASVVFCICRSDMTTSAISPAVLQTRAMAVERLRPGS